MSPSCCIKRLQRLADQANLGNDLERDRHDKLRDQRQLFRQGIITNYQRSKSSWKSIDHQSLRNMPANAIQTHGRWRLW